MIHELEIMNIKRLIDRALDEKDEKRFHRLVQLLKKETKDGKASHPTAPSIL
ncbi:IDEAL domain-containing protein [Virgibacillus sp. 179-BFC.A HS]|uniref:IDEAL domain-containing protein n=1 Tax=Tigheibacillus jepli TaxID=3035914 RepID=A0ABU5CFI2_9BACI|nr:IDEAL domain-containing protein [Virgibacillus sp. 179-BFC.A HS]MDY0405069.1 IDEAL domain-containing protein [Virgibacillus sp. 179-BFC.A HS]